VLLGVEVLAVLCCVVEDINDGPGTSVHIVSILPAKEDYGPYCC